MQRSAGTDRFVIRMRRDQGDRHIDGRALHETEQDIRQRNLHDF
jgi:hypothetical protein